MITHHVSVTGLASLPLIINNGKSTEKIQPLEYYIINIDSDK